MELSRRDLLAGMAMNSLIARTDDEHYSPLAIAIHAKHLADALISELDNTSPPKE